MGLFFEYATEQVEIPGGKPFAVRGLSLEDLSIIVGKHGDILAEIFNETAENAGSIQAATVANLAGELVRRAPEVAGLAIVLASDKVTSGDDVELLAATVSARRLPIHVQLDALQKVGTLTFGTEGGIKKAWETIISLLSGAKGLLEAQAA